MTPVISINILTKKKCGRGLEDHSRVLALILLARNVAVTHESIVIMNSGIL